MSDSRDADIPTAEVERRLEELRALYKLGIALRSARFLDGSSEVRDGPPPTWDPPPPRPTRES